MITIQNAKSPSYVTIRTTPFRWGVANRLAVVTVFPAPSVPGNDKFGNASLGGGACALPPCTIDNAWERGYNKDKGNTVGRRLALGVCYKNSRILWSGAATFYCSETER